MKAEVQKIILIFVNPAIILMNQNLQISQLTQKRTDFDICTNAIFYNDLRDIFCLTQLAGLGSWFHENTTLNGV